MMSEIPLHAVENSEEDLAAKKEFNQKQLQEAAFLLQAWYQSRDSDSVERQELRKREYSQVCEMLRDVAGKAHWLEQQITVTLAQDSEPIETRQMDQNAYNLVSFAKRG